MISKPEPQCDESESTELIVLVERSKEKTFLGELFLIFSLTCFVGRDLGTEFLFLSKGLSHCLIPPVVTLERFFTIVEKLQKCSEISVVEKDMAILDIL